MIPGTVYTLEREGEVLGTLTVSGSDALAIHADFQATPAFAPYRELFNQEALLTGRLARNPSPALLEEAEAVLERLLSLKLILRREGNLGYRTVLVSIESDRASFRPLTPEEEPL
ncbi:hypothetical protein [Deinococcus koreensis]|uniref:Uncharacterized protein n=1 Tax=Deinococcus koreensis TaxID=2054903 RepID=A0A2K3USY8_9DEIO|nr:hypothetical protein [Deinococcus koreensis]PNY79630.1 hypothetical protein CVO96_16820 [Deinococcus koreensis]